MRILVINPNTTASMTASIGAAASAAAAFGTEIVAVNPKDGPVSIESQYDAAYAVPGMLELIRDGEGQGYDGYVIACFRDPGLEAAREIAASPVVGIAEAAMHMASLIADGFSIIATLPRSVAVQQALARRYGFERHLRSVRAAGVPVLDLEDAHSGAADKVKRVVEEAITVDGAEAVLLGCAGMVDLAQRLSEETGVPVLDGVSAAVKLVEAMAGLGLKTSKARSYGSPRAKPYAGRYAAAAPGGGFWEGVVPTPSPTLPGTPPAKAAE
ncbi:MAG: aspartate/glutamate racemase family protein [Proteobacteria bacterium]|nr:aspartate/glutamate racemase family protein [Pseudomonadota bacterium]MBI3497538.1 aspartate/glutamate racemase family protein [Pseudomonadota bacterium]